MSGSLYTKEDYLVMANERRWAFQKIAKELGKDHQITKMMGTLAWGRHEAEQGPQPTLHSAIREMSFLDGYCHCIRLWARDNDYNAMKIINDIYPRSWRKAK